MPENPLGHTTKYSSTYSPALLFGMPRVDARKAAGIDAELPFSGIDLWQAWELTWLDSSGKPVVATAEFRIPADSANIIESKSLKLYLNSLAMTRYSNGEALAELIRKDLSNTAGSPVVVRLILADAWSSESLAGLPGRCIDAGDYAKSRSGNNDADPALLTRLDESVEVEQLHSHLFRSLCPVTRQPDMGSILICYSGAKIDPAGLLRYLISYREHPDFHEACVERIFVDILERCEPDRLTVQAFFNRRGGLDINPFRSNFDTAPDTLRLWRQ